MSPEEFKGKLARHKELGEQIKALRDEQWKLAQELAAEKCPYKVGDLVEIVKRSYRKPPVTKQYRVKQIRASMGGDPTWMPEVRAALIRKDGTESEQLTNITWDLDKKD